MSATDPAAVGAFLSGVGAVLGSFFTLRHLRKRGEEECNKRIAEIKQAIHEGVEIGEHHQ